MRSSMATALVIAASFATLAPPSGAHAYATASRFGEDPRTGGGGRRFFTGSRDDGFTCNVCHTGMETPEVDLTIEPLGGGRDLRETGYVPSETYEVLIQMPAAMRSAVSAELVRDADGSGVGTLLVPGDAELAVNQRCAFGGDPLPAGVYRETEPNDRAIYVTDACGIEEATFTWTAPAEPVGPIWFHAAIVAGDGDVIVDAEDTVRVFAQIIPVAGESIELSRVQTVCSVSTVGPGAGAGAGGATAALLGALGLLAFRRRHRVRCATHRLKTARGRAAPRLDDHA